VDLHEQRQLEVARQMAKVKARARPWRAIFALVLAGAAGIISSAAGRDFESWTGHDHAASKIVAASTAAAFCLLATVGILGLASRTRQALQPLTGTAHAAVIRYTIVLAGFILTLVLTLGLFKVPISQLIIGGALTTILIGIAAQQSLSNVFAGLVLLLSRPFTVGDAVQFRSGAMGGLLEGTVTEIGITYLRLDTADGPMSLPNAQVLAAAVSHPAQPSGATAPPAANGQQAAPATPGDAPAPGRAASDGQQAGPASLGLASSSQGGAAEKHQSAPGQPLASTAGPGEVTEGNKHPRPPRLRVRGLVPADDVRGNAPTLTQREPIRLRPSPDLCTVLAVRGRSPCRPQRPCRCLTGLRSITADRFIEPFAVPQA